MIEHGWDEYRAWALRSRTIQAERRKWNLAALACAVLAATLGAIAATLGNGKDGHVIAALAAIASVTTPILGRYLLETAGEAKWIQARATAEAIKSECFRAAARLDPYGGADARDVFLARRGELALPASNAGLVPLSDSVGSGEDHRRPPEPMDAVWYRAYRVQEQIGFYAKGQRKLEAETGRFQVAALATALIGAAFAALASTMDVTVFAPWIAAAATLGALIVAQGAMGRRQFLAASYGAMAGALARILERYDGPAVDLAALVNDTETLLQAEHAGWAVRMTSTTASQTDAAGSQPPPPERDGESK